ncbi:MAG TPA: hypothetical protein VEL03_03445 [Streptosporangiaceae bacterium]|nr:hypothetical protein [Streptosporangiaceae bacterium]
MPGRKDPITPLGAVVGGIAAGAAGIVSMDAVRYLRQRREGTEQSPLSWEFAPVRSWEDAPDPGKVAKRVLEGFLQREIPDRWAWLISTVMHWGYGSAWGSAYGVLVGSLRKAGPLYGLPFGALVWISGYLVLPEAGLYKPIAEYDAKTLGRDLSAHLAFGAGTGAAFWLLTELR